MDLTVAMLLAVAAIGLLAGVLGGLLGVGGSIIIIPGLTMLLGYDQHLYQAAAMIVNVAVSVPAAMRHHRAGAIVPRALTWMLPAAIVCVLLGVWLSNLSVFAGRSGGVWLGRLLAAFQVYVIYVNVQRLRFPRRDVYDLEQARLAPARLLGVGSAMGTIAGLLGIGGGAVAVPLQQVVLRLPLRNCIANSSAIICLSAAVGAVYKNATLAQHAPADAPLGWRQGLVLAALLAPTAWVGGRVGAGLTHSLPLRQVRIAFIALMVVAAWKMAKLPFSPF